MMNDQKNTKDHGTQSELRRDDSRDSGLDSHSEFKAVVMGASAGGLDAFQKVLAPLPPTFFLPILIVQHLHASDCGNFAHHLDQVVALPVFEPNDKEKIRSGVVYVAPANYHMLVERDESIALSIDPKVRWSRPSIDALFESAAVVWGNQLIAVILTGANDDGTRGMSMIRQRGGLTIAQDPGSAEYAVMPRSAVHAGCVTETLELHQIAEFLLNVERRVQTSHSPDQMRLDTRED